VIFGDYFKATADQMMKLMPVIQWPYHVKREIVIPECTIVLAPGEHYAGIICNGDSINKAYHVVLLAGDACPKNYNDALAWAVDSGGALPSCQEWLLLKTNCPKEFRDQLYWTSEGDDPTLAQAFYPPTCGVSPELKSEKFRVRAVAYYSVLEAE
jgi:hypothetical protein